MTIREHADRTESLLGQRAEDIHRWIDRYFDAEGFADFLRGGYRPGYDPYSHRRYRHCREALKDAREEFEGSYPPDVIDAIVERHIRDDYDGYFPYREDFEKGDFREKYHEGDSGILSAGSQGTDELTAYFRGKHYENISRNNRKKGSRFLWRFILPVSTALVLLLGSLYAVILPLSRENMLDLKKESVRELTAVAVGALEHYAARVHSGLMREEEARYEAAEEIRRMRYGEENKEYYWIIDASPRMVMHPYRKELEGEDLGNYRDREDSAGVYLFREAAELALDNGEGFIAYRWQHWDDPSALAPKLSYVRYFQEWDWIVGTGIYINDVEEEIDRLSLRLGAIFGGISLLSIALLIWVLSGALRMEQRREEAESGLRETKERYRALAEASTEGYMLISAGTALYVNPALCRITGRSEEDLLSSGPAGLLEPEMRINTPSGKALDALERGDTPSGTWTSRVLRGDGSAFEAEIGISRIFLPGSNGHVVSIRRPYTAGDRIGMTADQPDANRVGAEKSGSTAELVRQAPDRVSILEASEYLGDELTGLINEGAPVAGLRKAVADVYDAALARFADLAAAETLPSGSKAAIVSLGSNARREMTPFSDQDGAIIFREVPGVPVEETRSTWLAVARDLADGLAAAGFPRCDGGVMPMNPRWCLSRGEWESRLEEWISDPKPQSLMEINVVLDHRYVWGDSGLSDWLDGMLGALKDRSPGLVRMYRDNAMQYRPPSPGRRRKAPIDVKEALKPLETQLRYLSLVHGIRSPGTVERLRALRSAGVLSRNSAIDLRTSFETFWRLRFMKQIEGHRHPVRTDDSVDPSRLSALEQVHLYAALEAVRLFVERQALEAGRI